MLENLIWKVYAIMEGMTKEALVMLPVEIFNLLDQCMSDYV